MPGPSLRSRFLIGSLLWTGGLLLLAHMASLTFFRFMPRLRSTHGALVAISIAIGAMAIGLSRVRSGLSSVGELRDRLGRVRDGRAPRLDGTYPTEVQPLVEDLNSLLEHRERMVQRALAKAGDLAHGLKTPLAVLSHEAERAEAAGHHQLAANIGQQVERMRRQIDYHLAQARAAASGATLGTRCAVAESADGLTRTMQRLHADRGLVIAVHVPPDHAARAQREDLDEMLGNLIDNACKWARARVVIESHQRPGDRVDITVDDDGAGIAESMREAALQRGVRIDEAAPGSGLGLAIVRDLAELYGGSIGLETSPLGGLRARLTLPG
jgi:signal transduction histidine kinase